MDDLTANRRRFLQGAGVGGTALIAGCSELGLSQSEDGDSNGGSGGDREAAVVANVSQQELQQIQMEIRAQVQAGELDEAEAQQELQDRQMELLDERVSGMVDTLESETSITVEQEFTQSGVVRASGDADAFLDSLELEDVQSLVDASQLDQLEQAQENQSDESEGETDDDSQDDAGGNETETEDGGNETSGNETSGNETSGNETDE